jgi:PepSY-associated TM region
MRGIDSSLKAAVIAVHRWMGVIFCLLFLSWFCSGVGMMYFEYPMVSQADHLAHLPDLDSSMIHLTPDHAWERLRADDLPDQVRLSMFDGRPAYRFSSGGDETIVYADNGEIQTEFPPELTLRIASAWTAQPAEAAVVQQDATEDQWTVSGQFRALRPMSRYTWPDGEEVYVSTVTAQVEQYTTRRSRLAAYLGPIPHWLYFTPLRRHGSRWSRVVIGASALACGAALLGLIVGIWSYSPSKRFRYAGAPSANPYVGSKRWHMTIGLLFGPVACTWAFSGMLSMDPFPSLQAGSSERIAAQLASALREAPDALSAFDSKTPSAALLELDSDFHAKELELMSFAGEPVYLATAAANQSRVIPVSGEPSREFNRDKIIETVAHAARPATLSQVRTVREYEAYYLDRRHSLPLPAIFVQLSDVERSMYYIDPKTAQIVEAYDSRSRRNRWLYHGLHSMNFPWLYRYRPLWDFVLLAFLAGCIALSVTSLILAWKVLRRTLRKGRTEHCTRNTEPI